MTTQLYRPRAQPANLRSMSSTIGGTAIPVTHYRILTKEQPLATARCVAKHGPGAGFTDAPSVANSSTRYGRAGPRMPHARISVPHPRRVLLSFEWFIGAVG